MQSHLSEGDVLVKASAVLATRLKSLLAPALVATGLGAVGCTDGETRLGSDSVPKESAASREQGTSGPSTGGEGMAEHAAPGERVLSPAERRRPRGGLDLPQPIRASTPGRMGGGRQTEHVVIVSVDGLASRYLETLLDAGELPAFERLRQLGAGTLNARTDADYTYTLPNHTCMLTGLPVLAPAGDPEQGHGYTQNGNVPGDVTLHNTGNPARNYTPSVFDVAHDHGLRTALFASKSKFSLYVNSYNAFGAEDQQGVDDGREKIDVVAIDADLEALTDALLAELASRPPELSFVHYNQPDLTGHANGWGSEEYLAVLPVVDRQLGRLLDTIGESRTLARRTALAVTTDHGGTGSSHLDASDARNFVIPFFLVAPEVPAGSDLYALAGAAFRAPSGDNPSYSADRQPIRNGDVGNLALELLGLPHVDGSLMSSLGPALLAGAWARER